jgi:hypothetical protein
VLFCADEQKTSIIPRFFYFSVLGASLFSRGILYGTAQDTDLGTGNAMVEVVKSFASAEGSSVVVVSAQVESELAGLEQEDRADFLAELGVTDPTKVNPWSTSDDDNDEADRNG